MPADRLVDDYPDVMIGPAYGDDRPDIFLSVDYRGRLIGSGNIRPPEAFAKAADDG
jgi:hypothetical protein